MKQVLITGGTHGIGLATAKQLENEGYKVYVCARGVYETDINYIRCDVTNRSSVIAMMALLPNIDILICNAGGGGRWGDKDWTKTDYAVWQEVYDKNIGYIIYMLNNYIPKMMKKKWGRVITISSIYGKESYDETRPWFQSTKSAQISLMKSYSRNKDYVRNGITFNTVSPGSLMIEGTGWHKLFLENPEEYNKIVESYPMGKMGTAEDVANLILFLCSERANYINGSNIVIDGGQSYSF